MLKKILKGLLLIIVLIILVVLIQTWRFTKPIPHTKAENIPALPDSAIIHLSNAIKITTVSVSDSMPTDTTAFRQFKTFLETSYPLIHQHLKRTIIDSFSYIYFWQGSNQTSPRKPAARNYRLH